MGLKSQLTAARKLGNFLAGVFPRVASAGARLSRPLRSVAARVGLVRAHRWFVGTRPGKAALQLVDEFLWSSLAADRLDWAKVAPEAHRLLRLTLGVAAVLAVVVPLAVTRPWPSVAIETVSAATGPVAGWATPIWLGAEAIAWGALIAGAGAANRLALWAALVLYVWFGGLAVGSAGRSPANLLPPMAAAMALFRGEARLPLVGRARFAAALSGSVAVGAAIGLAALALTPLPKWCAPARLPLGLSLGAIAGAALFLLARRATRRPALLQTAVEVATLTAIGLALAARRGGVGRPMSALLDFLTVWTGYLWPCWYFLGVGIVFKLLKSTRVIQDAALAVMPARALVPLTWIIVVAGGALLWLPSVLDAPGVPWPRAVIALATRAWRWTAFLRGDPGGAEITELVRYILLGALVVLAWLASRRRLDGKAAAAVAYRGLLCWGLVAEYVSQRESLARSSRHTAILLLTFAVSFLWTLSRVGRRVAEQSSPRWPSEARTAIHGALVLFVLLAISARGGAGDPLITDEIYLELFRGLVDLGFAYFLYVWAQRTLGALPVPVPWLLGAFVAGGALAMALQALDKLAAAGSLAAFTTLVDARVDALLNGRVAPPLLLPEAWLAPRAAITAALLTAAASSLSRTRRGPVAGLFLITAVAAGLAAFSRAQVDLPLVPPRVMLILSPTGQPLDLDASTLAAYLTHLLPGLWLGLVTTWTLGWARWCAALVGAGLLVGGGLWAWPAHEAWLRSNGALMPLSLFALGLLLLMIALAQRRVRDLAPPREEAPAGGAPPEEPPRLARRSLLALALVGALISGGVFAERAARGRLVPRSLSAAASLATEPLRLPAFWSAVPLAQEAALFRAPSSGPVPPTLRVERREAPAGAEALLDRMVADAKAGVPGFVPGKRERWGDAVAQDWMYDQPWAGASIPLAATTVLVPDRAGGARVFILIATFGDWSERRWDLVRTLAPAR